MLLALLRELIAVSCVGLRHRRPHWSPDDIHALAAEGLVDGRLTRLPSLIPRRYAIGSFLPAQDAAAAAAAERACGSVDDRRGSTADKRPWREHVHGGSLQQLDSSVSVNGSAYRIHA